jgi:thermostable 8-oxoguanine DNA glycosylase
MSETKAKKTEYNSEKATEFFNQFPCEKIEEYSDYWNTIKPKNNECCFRRYLFAFCSVHTSWKGNVSGYNAIKNFEEWINDKDILHEKLKNSGVGLYNNRTNFIWDFKTKFWMSPENFNLDKKNHIKKRDSIIDNIVGLGIAKISFALEMCFPTSAKVLCGDVHQLRLYNMEHLNTKTKKGVKTYKKMENHWLSNCGRLKVPSFIARSIYWDKIQNKENTRYWSYVLED